jgi:nitronate monooxygenase
VREASGPIIISSLRAPPKEMLDAIHSYGGIVLHDVISIRHAKKRWKRASMA